MVDNIKFTSENTKFKFPYNLKPTKLYISDKILFLIKNENFDCKYFAYVAQNGFFSVRLCFLVFHLERL